MTRPAHQDKPDPVLSPACFWFSPGSGGTPPGPSGRSGHAGSLCWRTVAIGGDLRAVPRGRRSAPPSQRRTGYRIELSPPLGPGTPLAGQSGSGSTERPAGWRWPANAERSARPRRVAVVDRWPPSSGIATAAAGGTGRRQRTTPVPGAGRGRAPAWHLATQGRLKLCVASRPCPWLERLDRAQIDRVLAAEGPDRSVAAGCACRRRPEAPPGPGTSRGQMVPARVAASRRRASSRRGGAVSLVGEEDRVR